MGAANLLATIGPPVRFSKGRQVRSFCGLTPKSSETGETDCKGQPLTKAGPSRTRTTLMLAADAARKQDPQLARIYCLQMTERGGSHIKALCVVAANLAQRAWAVMQRGEPYHAAVPPDVPRSAPTARPGVKSGRRVHNPTCGASGAWDCIPPQVLDRIARPCRRAFQ